MQRAGGGLLSTDAARLEQLDERGDAAAVGDRRLVLLVGRESPERTGHVAVHFRMTL